MLVKSTSQSSLPATPVWAAPTATYLMASRPMHADYQSTRRSGGERVRLPIGSSSKGLDSALGDVFVFTDGSCLEQSSTTRETSEQEHIIATLRNWESFKANWDHEEAKAPNLGSLRAASAFVCALDRDFAMPAPMLHDTGHAGLFWESDRFYADLEFLESGSIAYYIESGNDRHKGVVAFDRRKIPEALEPLLKV